MKKILFGLLSILLMTQTCWAQISATELMGLGMSDQMASYFVTNGIALSTLANNAFLKSANATPAGANISVLKVDNANNTFLNAITGKVVKVAIASTPITSFDTNGITYIANTGLLAAPTAVNIAGGAGSTPIAKVDNTGFTLQSGNLLVTSSNSGVVLPAYVPTMVATPVVGTNNILEGMNVIPTAAANAAAIMGDATPVAGKDYYGVNTGPNTIRIKAGGGATINGATAGGWLPVGTLASFHCKSTSATNYNCELPVAPTPQGP